MAPITHCNAMKHWNQSYLLYGVYTLEYTRAEAAVTEMKNKLLLTSHIKLVSCTYHESAYVCIRIVHMDNQQNV